MSSPSLLTADLTCHPQSHAPGVRGLSVRVSERADGTLTFRYALDADITHLVVPPIRPTRAAHELWKHTCFEAFLAEPGSEAYTELNFAPSTEWARYHFERYREGMTPVLDPRAPTIVIRSDQQSLELDAVVRPGGVFADRNGAKLRIGVAAVLEHSDGSHSYWALRHAPGKPDFHHRDNFILEL
jgi:hypothetical protein